MSVIGIDVSTHNGTLDWAKLKAAGVKFAIIRAGYGRYQADSQFTNNIKGALAQGIPVGVYWFTYALDTDGAKAEAEKCLDTIKGYDVTLPVFFDFEYDTIRYAKEQGVTLGKTAFNAHTVAFCEAVRAAGYTPGVYYNLDYYRNMVDTSKLGSYVQWYAQYASKPSISGYDLWQYTSTGTFSGVSGKFDVNILENTDLLNGGKYTGPTGWQKNETGWWYAHEDGSYTKAGWEMIGGKWYHFDEEGYMESNKWVIGKETSYYLGDDGAMVKGRSLKIDENGGLVPAGDYYNTIGEVPAEYRETLDRLVAKGILKGKGGTGDDLVLDMPEDAVRILVILDRAGTI